MKTKFYFLPILLLGGLSLFTACSDDDDENGGGQPSGPVIGPSGTNSGARLTSISADWEKPRISNTMRMGRLSVSPKDNREKKTTGLP